MTNVPNHVSQPYWQYSLEDVLAQTGSSNAGLSPEEALTRLKAQGTVPRRSLFSRSLALLFEQLRNPLLLLLILTCAISTAVGEFTDAIIMGMILLGSLVLSFVQEFRAAIASDRLQQHFTLYSTVIRSGKQFQIPSGTVVRGDIIVLAAGYLIPADGVLVFAKDLFVNEAVLTGESLPSEKHVGTSEVTASISGRRNCVYMGTSVRSGSAKMLVQTGIATEFGRIAEKIQEPCEITTFEKGLHDLGHLLSRVMFVFLILVFLTHIMLHRPFLETMLFTLSIAIGISPQLLPAILSATLSRGSHPLAKQGVLVKRQ